MAKNIQIKPFLGQMFFTGSTASSVKMNINTTNNSIQFQDLAVNKRLFAFDVDGVLFFTNRIRRIYPLYRGNIRS